MPGYVPAFAYALAGSPEKGTAISIMHRHFFTPFVKVGHYQFDVNNNIYICQMIRRIPNIMDSKMLLIVVKYVVGCCLRSGVLNIQT